MKKSNAEKISEMLQIVAEMMTFPDGCDARNVREILHYGFIAKSEHWYAIAVQTKKDDPNLVIDAFIETAEKYEKIAEMINKAYYCDEN